MSRNRWPKLSIVIGESETIQKKKRAREIIKQRKQNIRRGMTSCATTRRETVGRYLLPCAAADVTLHFNRWRHLIGSWLRDWRTRGELSTVDVYFFKSGLVGLLLDNDSSFAEPRRNDSCAQLGLRIFWRMLWPHLSVTEMEYWGFFTWGFGPLVHALAPLVSDWNGILRRRSRGIMRNFHLE